MPFQNTITGQFQQIRQLFNAMQQAEQQTRNQLQQLVQVEQQNAQQLSQLAQKEQNTVQQLQQINQQQQHLWQSIQQCEQLTQQVEQQFRQNQTAPVGTQMNPATFTSTAYANPAQVSQFTSAPTQFTQFSNQGQYQPPAQYGQFQTQSHNAREQGVQYRAGQYGPYHNTPTLYQPFQQ